jgi:urease accessory protein
MQRATAVLAKGSFRPETVIDRVVLDFDGRYRRRIVLNTEGNRRILLDLAHTTRMNHGDAILVEDGVVLVVAHPEPLLEISAPDRDRLTRIAWHLGNRHIPTQLLGDRLRIRFDHVIEHLIIGLGGTVIHLNEPFDPEGGAYDDQALPMHDHDGNSHHQALAHHE